MTNLETFSDRRLDAYSDAVSAAVSHLDRGHIPRRKLDETIETRRIFHQELERVEREQRRRRLSDWLSRR